MVIIPVKNNQSKKPRFLQMRTGIISIMGEVTFHHRMNRRDPDGNPGLKNPAGDRGVPMDCRNHQDRDHSFVFNYPRRNSRVLYSLNL